MATRDEVLDAIKRIEDAGSTGAATRAARAALTLPLPPQGYDRVLSQLRSAFPSVFAPTGPPPDRRQPQQGAAVRAMQRAEAALAQQLSASATFDMQVVEALLQAHKTTADGRRGLDDLEVEIQTAAQAWDLNTAAGAREFQRFLLAKLGRIVSLVEDANDDDASKQALAEALAVLYAAEAGRDGSRPGDGQGAPGGGKPPEGPAGDPDVPAEPDPECYLDEAPTDESELFTGTEPPGSGAPTASAMPSIPGLGGESPGFGAMPAGGAPGGLPLAGLLSGLQREAPPDEYADDGALPPGDEVPADETPGEEDEDNAADGGSTTTPQPGDAAGPTTVTLPDGETTTAATPQIAAAMQAAADGTPIADAFRHQGIAIPPPGTPVAAPLDQSRLSPGDIGVFSDRHALAVGNGKALLDGQIQHVGNVRGPSFLGWQHPPAQPETAPPARVPAPTRPSTALRA